MTDTTEARHRTEGPEVSDITEPQYAARDHIELGEHYIRHVNAMTAEGLHAKSAIAAELAWRDQVIDSLRAEVAVLQMACSRWEQALEHGAGRIRKAEAEADSLRAQVEALRDTAGSVYRALGVFEPDARKWPAIIEALRADAERYRWLRLRKVATAPHEAIARHAAERFDAAIDAARSQEVAG